MKIIRVFGAFIIFYFVVTAGNGAIQLGETLSRGNQIIEIGYYVLLMVLFAYYIGIPMLRYVQQPSADVLPKLVAGDPKTVRKFRRYLLKNAGDESGALEKIDATDMIANQKWIIAYLERQLARNRKIVRMTAFKLTATVMISPNAFIDGLAVIFGTNRMIYDMSKSIHVRYTAKALLNMYFESLSVASVTGIVQEFDDEIEEIVETVVEEFGEFLSESSGKTVFESVPVASILAKSMVPIFQAAGNYAYVIYSGNRFIMTMGNALTDAPKNTREINQAARKIARKEKYAYVAEMTKKIGSSGKARIKRRFFQSQRKKSEEN